MGITFTLYIELSQIAWRRWSLSTPMLKFSMDSQPALSMLAIITLRNTGQLCNTKKAVQAFSRRQRHSGLTLV